VLEIAVSATNNDDVQVTIHLTSPPTLGGAVISTIFTGNFSVSWKLKKIFLRRFGKALKTRNLVSVFCSSTARSPSDGYIKEYWTSGEQEVIEGERNSS
jgi:hypothetical protein